MSVTVRPNALLAASRGARTALPVTTAGVALLVAVGVASGAMWSSAEGARVVRDVGYGLPAFEAGRWWTLLTGTLFAGDPRGYLPVLISLALLGGFAEWRYGRARALAAAGLCQIVAVVTAAAILAATRAWGWTWAESLAHSLDVGPSAGVVGAAAAATATLSPPWRGRLRASLLIWAALSLVYVGSLPDVEHAIALLLGLVAGPLLLARPPALVLRRLTARDHRLLVSGFLAVSAAAALLSSLAPPAGPLTAPVAGSVRFAAVHASHVLPGGAVVHAVVFVVLARLALRGRRRTWWAALAAVGVVTTVQVVAVLGLVSRDHTCWPVLLDNAILNTAGVGILLAGRHAFRNVSPRRSSGMRASLHWFARPQERQHATALLQAHGAVGRLAWMTTWRGNSWFFSADRRGFLAYRVGSGVALALGDPIAETRSSRSALLLDFAERARRDGLVPCVFAAGAETVDSAMTLGWRSVEVAQEAVIDLAALDFVGRRWQDVRTALNQAARRGITFRLVRLADEPDPVRDQVEEISRGWLREQGLPELGFTLGGVEEALDPQVLVGLAVDEEGTVHGVTSWLPIHRPGDGRVTGWTLDVMRRRPDGFRGVIEFLIARACTEFRSRGYSVVSLSAAPLARLTDEPRHGLEAVLDRLGERIEPWYGFRSLQAFKAKFQPVYEPLHLLFPDEAALPRIALAVASAYAPGPAWRTLRDLAHVASSDAGSTRDVHERNRPIAPSRANGGLLSSGALGGEER